MSTTASFETYPTPEEVDTWLGSIWELVDHATGSAELLPLQGFSHSFGVRHTRGFQYVRFSREGQPDFYGYWQPAVANPAPLLVHVPGYGAEMSVHPDLVAQGFNVLHVSPLGYSTPEGADTTRQRDGMWPVLPDSIASGGSAGYRLWLADCAAATRWALSQPECHDHRVSFFGSSQGGGGALLLASLFRDCGVRCVAADVPFLTDFRGGRGQGAYALFDQAVTQATDLQSAWRGVGLIDTLSHLHRLDLPVLLTAGGADGVCPPATIETLFRGLPGTRSYTFLKGVPHRYTVEFVPLAAAWFRMYA